MTDKTITFGTSHKFKSHNINGEVMLKNLYLFGLSYSSCSLVLRTVCKQKTLGHKL